MDCEICGAKSVSKKADIEGVVMNVCDECVRLGTLVEVLSGPKPFVQIPGSDLEIVENYASLVKAAREKSKLTREQFAARVKEKETVLARIENGKLKPSIYLAQRIEKAFGVKLLIA